MISVAANAIECNKFDPKAYEAELHKAIIAEAQLTPQEANKFFAIFDEMRAKERAVFEKKRGKIHKKLTTDEDYRNAIIGHDNDELEQKKMQIKYHNKMLKVLPAKKVFDALMAAKKFDNRKFREMTRNNKKGDKK